MGAILIALLPILQGLLAGGAVGSVLGALTVAQWVTIAASILTLATPEIEQGVADLHPVFTKLIADAKAHGPEVAGANVHAAVVAGDFGVWN